MKKYLIEAEYEDFLQPYTITNLKNKSQQSRQQTLGNKNLTQVMIGSQKILNKIIAAEDGYRDELEELAVQMARDFYPIIELTNIGIDAKIVGMNDLDIQIPPENNPSNPDFGKDDFKKATAKRRLINSITQGASIRGAYAFRLSDEYLKAINPELVNDYKEILDNSFGIYDDEDAIKLMLSLLSQGQKAQGGESKMEYDENKKQFVIKARAVCFPMLLHEIIKGLYEIVGTEGFGTDKEKNKAIIGKVDKVSNEPRDLQYGKFIYDAISDLYNESKIDDARVRELLFKAVYKLIDDEFFPFVENAINEGKYDIQALNNGEWQSVTDSYYDSKSKAEEALSQLQADNPETEYKIVYMGLKPLQKKWAMDTMQNFKRKLMKRDAGV